MSDASKSRSGANLGHQRDGRPDIGLLNGLAAGAHHEGEDGLARNEGRADAREEEKRAEELGVEID
jgi:hypothetical protein